jgi:glycerol-3-phosphate dehydrogenase
VSRRFDLLILGGGIQGATAACEAARRGLSVAVVERDDFGGGASSNSLKIAHGGVRYLQSADFARSFESTRERRRLLRIAPRYVRPLRCRIDVSRRSVAYKLALRAGLVLNDVLSLHRNRGVAAERRLPRASYPLWWDAMIEDTERVLWSFLHSAREWSPGSVLLANHAGNVEVAHDAQGWTAKVAGAGELHASALLRCVGASRPGQLVMLAMNLVIDAAPLTAGGQAVALAHPEDGRNLFAVPWRDRTMIGTYNRSYPCPADQPLRIDPAWIDELIEWVRPAHADFAGLTRRHVRLVHAGVLPRGRGGDADPAERPWLRAEPDGAIDVQGVKWTTSYGVSERALDAVETALGRAPRASRRTESPLVDPRDLLEAFIAADSARREPVLPGAALRVGDVLFAVEREHAKTLADALLRRTGAAAAGHPGVALAERTALLLQRTLGWSEATRREQLESFHADWHFAANAPPDTLGRT